MAASKQPLSDDDYLYRRLKPEQCNTVNNTAKSTGFVLRANEPDLSVYTASQPFHALIVNGLEFFLKRRESDDPEARKSADKWLAKYGSTAEEALDKGWRIARIKVAEFRKRGFNIGDIDDEGHVGIGGAPDEFDLYADELALASDILPVAECMPPQLPSE